MLELLSLYHPISWADQTQFHQLTHTSKYEKGDFLLFERDIQAKLYLVKSGVTAICSELDHTIKYLDFSYQNQFCIDIGSFSQQTPSKYCIQCLEDCEIESISYDELQNVFNVSQATERAYRLMIEERYVSLLEKSFIIENKSIRERFEWLMCEKPELFKLVPHKCIASYINIDVTNFSKLYNQLCINNGLLYS